MSPDTIDYLITFFMYVELYITLGALVGLIIRKEDHRFYPVPLWNTTPYVLLILFGWPVLLCAAPFWVARNRHRTAESVCEELYQRRREATYAMFKAHGLDFSADLLKTEPPTVTGSNNVKTDKK